MKKKNRKSSQTFAIFVFIFVGGLLTSVRADIPQDAQQAADNARRTGQLVILARAAEARGDYLTCAALAKEADRIATVTNIIKEQVIAEYNQLPPAQQQLVFRDKEAVIADATITRQDADQIRGCLNRVKTIVFLVVLFLVILFVWLYRKAFGPFFK